LPATAKNAWQIRPRRRPNADDDVIKRLAKSRDRSAMATKPPWIPSAAS
jgi:hypothetical protein